MTRIFLDIIQQNPNATTADVEAILEQTYGKRITNATVGRLLRDIAWEGLIKQDKRKGKYYWHITDIDPEFTGL